MIFGVPLKRKKSVVNKHPPCSHFKRKERKTDTRRRKEAKTHTAVYMELRWSRGTVLGSWEPDRGITHLHPGVKKKRKKKRKKIKGHYLSHIQHTVM